MVLGIIFVVLAVIVVAVTPLIIKHLESQQKVSVKLPIKRKSTAKEVSLRDVWEIQDIRNGIIYLPRGCRTILSLGAVDYSLMSPEARMSVVSALVGAVMSFASPVQVFGTAEGVNTESYVDEIYSFLPEAPDSFSRYGMALASYLTELTRNHAVQVYQRYLVLTVNGDYESAVRELDRQASVVASILNPAGINVQRLGTEGVVDLLCHVFNRGQSIKPSELIKTGGLYFFKQGVADDVIQETAVERRTA